MQAPHTQLPVPGRWDQPRRGASHLETARLQGLADVRKMQDARFDAFIRQVDKQLLARTDDLGVMYRRGVVR